MYSVVVFYYLWWIFYEVVVLFDGVCHRPAASEAGATQRPRGPNKSILGKDIIYTKIYHQTKL